MQNEIVPIILSGGAGSRLWPASRQRQPKQLLPLVDGRSMFLTTLQRSVGLPDTQTPMVVSNEAHRGGIERELALARMTDARIMLEPVGRNTAPALAAAALDLTGRGRDPLLLVLPADHIIPDQAALAEAVGIAADLAADGHLVTFGVAPVHAETGYGYIEVGDDLTGGAKAVAAFREKPDLDTASRYVEDGRHLWNSGMFLFRASGYLEELDRHRPDVLAAAREALVGGKDDGVVITLDRTAMENAPAISIDYAVMEPTQRAAVVPLDAGWTDVGSWEALWALGDADEDGNVIEGDTELIDVTNSLIRSRGRLVAAIGLDGVAVVDSQDATLVTALDRVQDVKEIVDRLSEQQRREVETDGSESRPWGGFATLIDNPGFRVLHLWIEPGGKTSVQRHQHRFEYWIVVQGSAMITIGEDTRLIEEAESVLVPAGEIHRLENPSAGERLELIEVAVAVATAEHEE